MNTLEQYSLKVYFENTKAIDSIYNYVIKKFPKKYGYYTKNQKYNLRTIVTELIYFIQSGVSYKNYRGPINAKTLNSHALFFSKNRIFEKVYELRHNVYLDSKTATKFKYQSLDTSYIMNKNGKEDIGRNKHFKNKNCFKLSTIVDSNGVPLSVSINPGNNNDAKIGEIDIDNIGYQVKEINEFCRPYMLADKMYDTKNFREKCIKSNYRPIIDYNKRNTKDEKLIKRLTKKQRKIYKKRIVVENRFCIIKKYKRLQLIYDSYSKTYLSFVYLALCCMIEKYF